MVRLQPNPSVSAACGQSVTLKCDVVSPLDKLSIKHMAWSLNQKPLCSVDAHENFTSHPGSDFRYFHCEYIRGRLWLVLAEVRPREAINLDFMCKLKSNRGAKHINTRVELQGQNHILFILSRASLTAPRVCTAVLHTLLSHKDPSTSIITLNKPVMVQSKSELSIHTPKGKFYTWLMVFIWHIWLQPAVTQSNLCWTSRCFIGNALQLSQTAKFSCSAFQPKKKTKTPGQRL